MVDFFAHRWVSAAIVLLGSIALGYVFRFVFVRKLRAVFAKTATDLDDFWLAATQWHLLYWCILAGTVVAARVAPIPDKTVNVIDRIAAVGIVLSLAFAGSSLATRFLARHAGNDHAGIGTTSLMQNGIRVAIIAIAGLLVLQNLGISVTPVLTALGIGSLAVALALQPTLSNLFAGVHLAVSRNIRVGDFVQLEQGSRGYVEDIGWRETRLRELPDNFITVPNARLVDMIVTNFSAITSEQGVQVTLGVSYESDLDLVERVTLEVARDVLANAAGAVREHEPSLRFTAFADSAITMVVNLRVHEFTDRFSVTHEFIKQLKARFAADGIEIPYPQRVVRVIGDPVAPVGPGAA